jgi:hypothetical protein
LASKKLINYLAGLTQAQRERLYYIEVKAFFCGDLTRSDIERRFGVGSAASARDLSSYRQLAPHNLVYDAASRNYKPSPRFVAVFKHSADRVLAWFRDGYGDSLDLKIRRTVPCESATDLVKPDLETLAVLTRAISGHKQVKVEYLSLTSGASIKTISPLALADTGQRWHLRAYDCERDRFADFSITRIAKAKPIDQDIPLSQRLDADIQWTRVVRLELIPHPGIKHPEAIASDYQMKNRMLVLDIRAPLVGYALRRWAVDCTVDQSLDPNQHHLCLKNLKTLYGVESAKLAPGYSFEEVSIESL